MDQQNEPFIEARGLGVKTPEGVVFENATFKIEEGKVCALFGSEGCGKTSLLLVLGGRMKFNSGELRVCGFDMKKQYKKVRDLSGISVIERVNDVPRYLRVRDIVAAELSMAGRPGNKQGVIDYLNEWDFAHNIDVPYNKLAAHDRYLFEIMLAATTLPKLLLVDEIQNGMTRKESLDMIDLFRRLWEKKNITTVFAVNEYEIAAAADCMVVLDEPAETQREHVIKKRGCVGHAPVVGRANDADVTVAYDSATASPVEAPVDSASELADSSITEGEVR